MLVLCPCSHFHKLFCYAAWLAETQECAVSWKRKWHFHISQFFELKFLCNQSAALFLLKCSTTSTPVPASWYSSTTYAGTAVSLNWYWGDTRVSPRKQ